VARKKTSQLKIGLISDTHGLLRPEALSALRGVQRIIHAGDIGSPEILEQLGTLASVDAVRGNNDKGAWADPLPLYQALDFAGVSIYVVHDLKEMDIDPDAAGFDVVVSGHSHQPSIAEKQGIQYVNPGSAGPRRFRLPVTVAYLDLVGGKVRARILEIL
jgi:putative phosphoesterase